MLSAVLENKFIVLFIVVFGSATFIIDINSLWMASNMPHKYTVQYDHSNYETTTTTKQTQNRIKVKNSYENGGTGLS